jgi:DNA-binding GntR family transcriptional regulator
MATIRIESLPQEIAKRLREMIRKGVLKKGDRITEKPLCQDMGVSRTPLREALRLLSSEGLIQLVPNKGAFVAQPSIEEIKEMFWVMSILEGTCARVCAERLTVNGFKKLDTLHVRLERHFEQENHEKYMDVNHSYHTLVQELAGSKILSEVINGFRQKILLYRYRQIYQPNRLEESMHEHRHIHEAFRKRDPEAAERLMKEHLLKQYQALESHHSRVTKAPNNPLRCSDNDSHT